MIREIVNECLEVTKLNIEDLVKYCEVTEAEAWELLNDGEYTIDTADKVISRLAICLNKDDLSVAQIPHLELDNGIILFKKDSENQCRLLVVQNKGQTRLESLTDKCFKLSIV